MAGDAGFAVLPTHCPVYKQSPVPLHTNLDKVVPQHAKVHGRFSFALPTDAEVR